MNKKVQFIDLGLIDYKRAWDFQTDIFDSILSVKSLNRSLPSGNQQQTDNYLIFCEHPHVFTLGKSGKVGNLLVPPDTLSSIDATYHHINRGGDITYHGPGQIVGYPVIDLENFFTDIHQYMRLMEEAVIHTVRAYGINAGRIPGLTGVWVNAENPADARKICALGVKTSRWVTMHGFALNVNTDLSYFGYIVPCGIHDKAVTSMQKELSATMDLLEVGNILKQNLATQFGFEWTEENKLRMTKYE